MSANTVNTTDYCEIQRRGVKLKHKIYKKITEADLKTCARHLAVWRNKRLNLANTEEMDLFTDYACYGYQPHGFNMAEKYRRLYSQDADAYDSALLPKMCTARYAIYQVTQNHGQEGFAAIDVFSKRQYVIASSQLATTLPAKTMLAGYLIEFEDFFIQTGGTVWVTRDILQAEEVVRVIDLIDNDQVASFLNDPNRGAKLARAIASATIRLGRTKALSRALG